MRYLKTIIILLLLINTCCTTSGLDVNLAFHGNSLVQGVNASGINQYFPKRVRDSIEPLVNSLSFISSGVGGQNIEQMIANASTEVDQTIDNNKINILVALEGANQTLNILGSPPKSTGEEAYNLMANTYVPERITAGWDYIIVPSNYAVRKDDDNVYRVRFSGNVLVIDSSSISKYENYNNLIRSSITSVNPTIVHTVDFDVLPNIGSASSEYVVTEYNGDYIHNTALGYDPIADNALTPLIISILKNN